MIGGQIIIPLRDENGNKITITTTAKNLKPGTYAKILRAINMQKELVFEDVNYGPVGKTASSASISLCVGLDTDESFRLVVSYIATNGSTASSSAKITKGDTIVVI